MRGPGATVEGERAPAGRAQRARGRGATLRRDGARARCIGGSGGDLARTGGGRAGTRLARGPSRMSDLRVPKRRVAAEVVLPGGEVRRISLFLAEAASSHAGPERPSDLLNGGAEFVPALDEEGGAMTFLNRAGLAVVRVDPALEVEDADALTLPTEHEVEVRLGTGETLRGLVSYLRPPDHSRLVDFLNEAPPFFRLLEERAIALVNKRHVSRVALLKP
jgi:hypothetical protein